MSNAPRTVVIGGGIIGLASAWRLARAGCAVTLFDAAPEAREASWAAAGMLAPHHEADDAGPLWRLGVESLTRWSGFVRELCDDPRRVDYREHGGLMPALDAADAALIERKRALLRSHDIVAQWLTQAELRRVEPGLNRACTGALLIPAAQVNPRLMTEALRDACIGLGVVLRYGAAVEACVDEGITLVGGERVHAEEVVLASGAWTPALARLSGLDLRGEPVKGQMLRLVARDDALAHFIHSHHAYLVPRHGQGIVVGSTMVMNGFDRSEDPAAVARLAADARRLLPALTDAPIAESWTGLRPRLASGLPLIARVRPGLILATGHFRNGVLLTPATAIAIACLVTNQPMPFEVSAFAYSSDRTP